MITHSPAPRSLQILLCGVLWRHMLRQSQIVSMTLGRGVDGWKRWMRTLRDRWHVERMVETTLCMKSQWRTCQMQGAHYRS